MSSQTFALRIAAAVFALVFLAHVLRLVAKIDVMVGSWPLPMWISVVGALLSGALGLWLWRLSQPGSAR